MPAPQQTARNKDKEWKKKILRLIFKHLRDRKLLRRWIPTSELSIDGLSIMDLVKGLAREALGPPVGLSALRVDVNVGVDALILFTTFRPRNGFRNLDIGRGNWVYVASVKTGQTIDPVADHGAAPAPADLVESYATKEIARGKKELSKRQDQLVKTASSAELRDLPSLQLGQKRRPRRSPGPRRVCHTCGRAWSTTTLHFCA